MITPERGWRQTFTNMRPLICLTSLPITETGVPEVRSLETALSTDLRRQCLNSTLPKLLPVALHYPRG